MAVHRGQLHDPQLVMRIVVPTVVIALVIGLASGTTVGGYVFLAATGLALAYAIDAVVAPARQALLSRLGQGAIIILLLAVPLAVDPGADSLYDVSKFTVLIVGTAIAVALVTLKRLMGGSPVILRNGLEIPIAALVGAIALATLFSDNYRLGILGDYESYDGLLTTVLFAALLYATVHTFTINDIPRLMKVLFFGATGVALVYGIVQGIDSAFDVGLDFVETRGVGPLWSTLPNKNHYGGFLAILLPVGIALLVNATTTRQRIVSAVALVLLLVELVAVRSLGALLGAVAGLVVFGWYQRRELLGLWRKGGPGARALAAGGVLLGPAVGLLALVRLLPSLRGVDASLVGGGRLLFWGAALQMARSDPLTGVGPDAFLTHFWVHQTQPYVDAYTSNQLVNGAHNILFNYLATTGIVGLLAFVMLVAFIFLRGTAVLRRLQSSIDRGDVEARGVSVLLAAALGGVAAYLGQAMFNVQHVATMFPFWVFAAILCTAALDVGVPVSLDPRSVLARIPSDPDPAAPQKSGKKRRDKKPAARSGLPVAAARTDHRPSTSVGRTGLWATCILCGVVAWAGIAPLRADRAYRRGLLLEAAAAGAESEQAMRFRAGAYELFEDAWSSNPWEPRYADNAGEARLRFPVDLEAVVPSPDDLEAVGQQYSSAIGWIDDGLEVEPRDPFLWASRGEAYFRLYQLTNEETDLTAAIESLERSLEINPWLSDAVALLVNVHMATDQPDEARRVLATALDLNPEDEKLRELAEELKLD